MPTFNRQQKISCLITEGTLTDRSFAELSPQILNKIRFAAENHLSLIQIREKKLSAKNLFELTKKASEICAGAPTKILVNDRADVALASGADGVQLTSKSLHARHINQIRQNLFHTENKFLIGVSAHSLEDCRQARDEGADFALISPIFPTPHKGKPLGLAKLKEIVCDVKLFPLIALGGIDSQNLNEVLSVADGFAAIRFFTNEENIIKTGRFSINLDNPAL